MPPFAQKYSDAERDAVRDYAATHPDATGNEIADLARRGMLKVAGEPVPAFTMPPATVRDLKRRARRAAEGRARSALETAPARDALEQLRRRLVSATDHKLAHVERLINNGAHERVNGEDLRQLARAVREIAAIPGADGSPAAGRRPGEHVPGTGKATGDAATDGGRTRGGLAGSIIAAAQPKRINAEPAPVPEDVDLAGDELGETADADATTSEDSERINAGDSDDPGSYARGRIAELARVAYPARPAT